MLDTLRQVETPEGLALPLRCAGIVPRALAWAVDLMLRMILLTMAMTLLALLGNGGMGIALLVIFVLYWGYNVLFEVLRNGQTPGKQMLGLRVVNDNGTPIGWLPAIVRNLLRTVDMFPVLYGFGVAASLTDADARRLGDMVAGTVVVYVDSAGAQGATPDAAPVPPPVPLRIDEQVAIVAFAERSPQLTPERQQEIAGLLQPVLGGHGPANPRRAWGLANYLLGRA